MEEEKFALHSDVPGKLLRTKIPWGPKVIPFTSCQENDRIQLRIIPNDETAPELRHSLLSGPSGREGPWLPGCPEGRDGTGALQRGLSASAPPAAGSYAAVQVRRFRAVLPPGKESVKARVQKPAMSTLQKTILIVDPDRENREYLQKLLEEEHSLHVEMAPDPEVAHNILERIKADVLLTAIFPERQGLELLERVAGKHLPLVSVACLPSGDRESVVQALNAGAQYYINTPLRAQEIRLIVRKALDACDKLAHPGTPDLELRKSHGFHGIAGANKEMHKLFNLVEKIAEDGESTVLIQGESGAGKELVAQALHDHSPRQKQKLVPINCAAIPEELLESELFGYEKGAFTGANQAKQGRLHYANKGTLFLDEIGDMRPALQAKLLRVLQEKEFEPVGSVKPHKVDVRVVAATRCDLEEEVNAGKFREDLYYRLSVVPIRVPPLRERPDDIPLLLDKFIHLYQRNRRGSLKSFSPEAVEVLKKYSWPGNVRELKNLVQRLCILQDKETVDIADLPEQFFSETEEHTTAGSAASSEESSQVIQDSKIDFNTQVSEFEDRLILQALIAANGNKKQAARNLNLKRTTLLEKIKKKNLDKLYLQYLE